MSTTCRLSPAFTLIELLVVMSIIAILSALLLPAAGLVRSMSRSLVCASNLRQIGIGLQTYSSEWHGLYPAAQQPGPWNGPGQPAVNGLWCGAIREILPSGPVYACSEAPVVKSGMLNFAAPDDDIWGQQAVMTSSYGVNSWIY